MDDRRLLNNMTPGSKRAGLGDRLIAVEATATASADAVKDLPGAAVPDSEEVTSPTVAEFNALLASLRAAGVITPSE